MLPGAIFRVFSAGSKTTLSCAYLWTELHQTRFPRLLQAFPPESSFGNGKTPLLAVWHGFGVFLAGSKTTLFCAYLWTELHQIRFRGLLQAIPPESSVENGKIPVLADWHGFGRFLAFFRQAPRRRCSALTSGPNCTKLGFVGFCRPFHRNQALKTVKYQY